MLKNILEKSLHLTWQTPSFWFWGALATLLFFSTNDLAIISILPSLFTQNSSLEKNLIGNGSIITLPLFFLLLAILLIVGLFLLAVFSEVKLILSITKKYNHQNNLLETPKKKSLKVIILIRALEFVMILALWSPSLLWLQQANFVFSFFVIFISSLLGLIFLFVARYAIFYVLVEKQNFGKALSSAWQFFKTNFLKTLKLSFILFIFVFIYSFFWLLLVDGGAMMYPIRLVNMVLTNLGGNYGFWVSFLVTAILGTMIQLILVGFIIAYQTTCWVVFFLEKLKKPVNNL